MTLSDEIKIQKNKDTSLPINFYQCYASKGCRFYFKTEKFQDEAWETIRNERFIGINPEGKYLYIMYMI